MTIKLSFIQNEVWQLLLESPKSLFAIRTDLNYRLDKTKTAIEGLLNKGFVKSVSHGVYKAIPVDYDVVVMSYTRPKKNKTAPEKENLMPVPDPRMRLNLTDKQREVIIASLPKLASKEMKRTELAKLVKMRKMDLIQVLVFEFKVSS